jgi:hypothetical protein
LPNNLKHPDRHSHPAEGMTTSICLFWVEPVRERRLSPDGSFTNAVVLAEANGRLVSKQMALIGPTPH